MKKKVVVAMSGGVDSSVAAALLKQEGHEVIGVTLQLFAEERGSPACCGAAEAGGMARAVCGALGIRHYLKDAREVFKKKVIDEFVRSYAAGATPNPCVSCNRFVKFSYLSGLAKALGAGFLATGHYARIEKCGGEFGLLRGADPLKDQSYFLYCLEKEQLSRVLFPLGALAKAEVRKMARELDLPAAKAKESSDICFVGEGNYAGYLKKNGGLKPRPGRIVDARGKLLGRHEGFFNYTVGQRRGIGVHGGERLYVTALRPESDEVVLGPLAEAAFRSFEAAGVNWLVKKPAAGARVYAQIRYRHKPAPCLAVSTEGDGFSGVFDEPQFAPARGQSVVFYDGDRVLGGGIVSEVRK
ncbi:MAG: tRNA 2-thiouridine(34) synthase MnmA [Elusimicrobia bacterium RIFOXYB2_FULL_62_6]|nr:MAG: tRNA 2-thiouridine(34) synthase MnmA [Elusimicrobia bacterium RIFOXYB2_FULL_62_6]